jgi:predicted RNase H-like nuclease
MTVIGVDMPIGLPTRWGREADRQARRFLVGGRASSVFPVPPRSLIEETDYARANRRSQQELGQGLSRQTFHLFDKIREVDALARSAPGRLVEIHPECTFRLLARAPLPSKRTAEGRRVRLELLQPLFGEVVTAPLPGAGGDDVLDAFAVLWSAERYSRGEHLTHGDGELDQHGLPMRIVT